MSVLERSWGSFSRDIARRYLVSFGHPSEESKRLLVDVLKGIAREHPKILDLGCGNANLCEYFSQQRFECDYTGVDFSSSLLEAATSTVELIHDDVNSLETLTGSWDIAVYSHVLELLESPERSLLRARHLAGKVVVRFYEPPEFDVDTVELLELDLGEGRTAPYIRRKMSRDYYRLILSKMGCNSVDVYRDLNSKDQVHVLHY